MNERMNWWRSIRGVRAFLNHKSSSYKFFECELRMIMVCILRCHTYYRALKIMLNIMCTRFEFECVWVCLDLLKLYKLYNLLVYRSDANAMIYKITSNFACSDYHLNVDSTSISLEQNIHSKSSMPHAAPCRLMPKLLTTIEMPLIFGNGGPWTYLNNFDSTFGVVTSSILAMNL